MLFILLVTTQGRCAFPCCLFTPVYMFTVLTTPGCTKASPHKSHEWLYIAKSKWPFTVITFLDLSTIIKSATASGNPLHQAPARPHSSGFCAHYSVTIKHVGSPNTRWLFVKSFLSFDSSNDCKEYDLFLPMWLFLFLRIERIYQTTFFSFKRWLTSTF